MLPILPSDFFQPEELLSLAGTKQRGRLITWLKQCGTPHVIGLHRWPLVYRSQLLPQQQKQAQNEKPKFDFSAAHATSRKAAQGQQ